MSIENQTYTKAKKIILGANSLLSKRKEMILPGNKWPNYFSKAKDVYVWDLNNKKYIDMMMAVGQSPLGYANSKIDKYVLSNAKKGNITSLNCREEVLLAEKLVKLHPWSGMVKFARTGGEANALAIRIARAATNREHVAVCGYHGWHDWYLSVNLKKKDGLSKHLLPGLSPIGVPYKLKGLTHPFFYGDQKKITWLSKKYKLAAIIMEVCRGSFPDKKFLKFVRKLANEKKIVLIFDECTTGFRRNLGGIHLTQNINPDLCMLGKALGNGYAITAVIGKKKIMNKAQKSFISSTYWSERIGFLAGLKSIEVMKKEKHWKKLIILGKYINKKWKYLAKKNKLNIIISGFESITSFNFISKDNLKYKTFITQEMLKKGYLANNTLFLSNKHNKKIIDNYIKVLDKIFFKISQFEKNKKNINDHLENSVCWNPFTRLSN